MKKILGLDLGTNSIGWALIDYDPNNKNGKIIGLGTRIIPMDQGVLGKFNTGQTISQTAERTAYRGTRRLYQRDHLRRERLHRVLNILGFLPVHYKNSIDFEERLGQYKPNTEVKLPYRKNKGGKHQFIFQESFNEMVDEFKANGQDIKLPYDWTLYYLRKKALTQKISKEELAWVILNFNQKRGYYQLRGEEDDSRNDKLEEYHVLTVSEVEKTNDSNNKGTWYNIHLENGWTYKRQSKDPLFSWKDKQKEFIVTTNLEKDGSVKKDQYGHEKRSFRAVDSEKDWIAIKKKTEGDVIGSGKMVGAYIFEELLKNPTHKIRGKLIKTIERKFYKEELAAIFKKQAEFHPEFQDKYLECVYELYPHNEAHKNTLSSKNLAYLIIEDIIFYQRPLKSKKSTIADCPYEFRTYMVNGEKKTKALKCISKSNPLFQEFRIWQWIHNLKIYQREGIKNEKNGINIDVTCNFLKDIPAYEDLFNYLYNKKEIDQKSLLKHFGLTEKEYRWNYPEDKKYPCGETRAQIAARIKKVTSLKNENITENFIFQLWHIIYSVTDKKEYEKALGTFAEKHGIIKRDFVALFKSFPTFDSSYGSYSEKAIKKLLPLMRLGSRWAENAINDEVKKRINNITKRLKEIDYNPEKTEDISDSDITNRLLKAFAKPHIRDNAFQRLNTYQACYAVYNRYAEIGDVLYWKQPKDIDEYIKKFKQHSLRNPIVEQVTLETLRVVKDIWESFGEKEIVNEKETYKKCFDSIHIELGREMKNDKKSRERISKENFINQNTNERIKAILEELKADPSISGDIRPHSPSQQETLKIYEEGVSQNPTVRFDTLKEDEIEKIKRNTKPSKSEILKYKLWLEQGYISPYTGKTIPLSNLFSTAYQIEHIIPQSRYFDNSLSNKVICESVVNQEKDNKTAYEFIKEKGGVLIETGNGEPPIRILKLEEYESHCGNYFNKNPKKLTNLLSEDIPEDFINRQLNDSRYISKVIKGLLSNIVREEGEQEVTSKNVIVMPGKITARLKKDWGLHDKWNELMVPRFMRLNKIKKTKDYGYWDDHINAFRIQVPKEYERDFSVKRIDHRHHALDALVISCTTREHINYLNSLNSERNNKSLVRKLRHIEEIIDHKGKKRQVAKSFLLPWEGFPVEAKSKLEQIIVSFKQNKRIINKTNNKTWQWVVQQDGILKKELIKQVKGENWAIRKPMHKETVSGKIYNIPTPKGKTATASRVKLQEITNRKRLESIPDPNIKKILNNHIKNYFLQNKERFDLAFNDEGIEALNNNIQVLNEGKKHLSIYKVKVYEIGTPFTISDTGQKATKYVEAAKGTNLFFNIYWNENRQKRIFETVPINEVITHQKQTAHLSTKERTEAPVDHSKGKFLFSLSPNDLVFVPTEEEMINPDLVDLSNLSKSQTNQIYKMVSCTGGECHFTPSKNAREIVKNEQGTNSKSERVQNENILDSDGKLSMIKGRCWKLKVDRLGNIINIIK